MISTGKRWRLYGNGAAFTTPCRATRPARRPSTPTANLTMPPAHPRPDPPDQTPTPPTPRSTRRLLADSGLTCGVGSAVVVVVGVPEETTTARHNSVRLCGRSVCVSCALRPVKVPEQVLGAIRSGGLGWGAVWRRGGRDIRRRAGR
jgi:hypothetical protein